MELLCSRCVYMVREAMRGSFKIQANYYGSNAPALAGAVTLQVDVFTHFGRPNQKHKSITLRLTEAKEVVDIGQIEF
jgi:Ca-activated chloride channel homolog